MSNIPDWDEIRRLSKEAEDLANRLHTLDKEMLSTFLPSLQKDDAYLRHALNIIPMCCVVTRNRIFDIIEGCYFPEEE